MRTADLLRPTVPVTYAWLVLDAATAHGVEPGTILGATEVDAAAVADPNQRISMVDLAALVERTIELTGEPALGYEIALGSSVMSHGTVGFGMLTSSSLREAIDLGLEFLHLRVPMLSAELRVEGEDAVISVVETVPLGSLRRLMFDLFLVKLVRIGQSLTDGRVRPDQVELRFDYSAPEYLPAYRDRLPPMTFDAGTNELRFPAALLDRRPDTADPAQARLAELQCREEEARIALPADLVGRVRLELRRSTASYPSLSDVAEALHTSSRTLKRHLHDHGTTFQEVLDAERQAEATRLLTTTPLPVEQIAQRLGYADARSFRRAFRSWTGLTPGAYRTAERASD